MTPEIPLRPDNPWPDRIRAIRLEMGRRAGLKDAWGRPLPITQYDLSHRITGRFTNAVARWESGNTRPNVKHELKILSLERQLGLRKVGYDVNPLTDTPPEGPDS